MTPESDSGYRFVLVGGTTLSLVTTTRTLSALSKDSERNGIKLNFITTVKSCVSMDSLAGRIHEMPFSDWCE
jgi:hypothetical protein